jgi:hypothetical protein
MGTGATVMRLLWPLVSVVQPDVALGTQLLAVIQMSAGGVTVTNATAPLSTNTSTTAGTAYWTPSASITYTTVTLSTAFDTVFIYNSTQSNKAVSVHTFGSQTITAGTFTLTMPANTTAAALLRIATT